MGFVGDVVALDEHVAGVEAEAEALVATGAVDQVGDLVEIAGQQAFVAGGLLEQQPAGVAVLEGACDRFGGALDRGCERLFFL